jgi:hypothetical protein
MRAHIMWLPGDGPPRYGVNCPACGEAIVREATEEELPEWGIRPGATYTHSCGRTLTIPPLPMHQLA